MGAVMINQENAYDVVIVGAGAAGLTSAAYLCKKGYKVLLCEKSEKTGGLVSSFQYNGFFFDTGIRAFENSGIIFPMLKQLGIQIEFIKNPVGGLFLFVSGFYIRSKAKEYAKNFLQTWDVVLSTKKFYPCELKK